MSNKMDKSHAMYIVEYYIAINKHKFPHMKHELILLP
jgi:hypothetical protein